MLDRILGLVTRVRPGEGATALWLSLNVFLLLTAYYVIKPVREALILSTGGAEVKAYAAVGQVLLLSLLVPAYGALAERVSRQKLIPLVTAGFCACLVAFYFGTIFSIPRLGVIFYLFVGVFNLMVIAQFWSFANDVYTPEEGERLFPIVAFGASVGSVAGSGLTSYLVELTGVAQLLLVSSGILGSTILVTRVIEHRVKKEDHGSDEAPASSSRRESSPPDSSPKEKRGGFGLVAKSPYLLMIAGLMFFANLVNTTGEYILGSVVEHAAPARAAAMDMKIPAFIGKFYADFFLVVNIAGVVLQAFFVSRIIEKLGVRGSILVLPCIALGSYVVIALIPVLAAVRWSKTAENATDYSLNNTVRNALFLPLSPQEKYKAKQATDTFFVRGGDVASAGVVWLGTQLDFSTSSYAWVNVGGVGISLALAIAIGRLYHKKAHSDSDEREASAGSNQP